MDKSLLMDDLHKGNREMLKEVYKQYREEFAFWLKKNFNCPLDESMEIYQEAILVLYENITDNKLENLNSSLKTYLFSIGKNKYFEWQRFNNKTIHDIEQLNAVRDDGEEQYHQKQIAEEKLLLVEKSLKRLGENCQKLLKLFYFEKLSMDEIMEKLNYKNNNTAKNQKYKCMNQLRKMHLQKLSGEYEQR